MKEQEIKNGKIVSTNKLAYEAPKLHTQEIDLEYGIAQTSGFDVESSRAVESENRDWLGNW